MGERPPLGTYLKQLWGRRAFVNALASARNEAANSQHRLGQAWQVLNPLLAAATFYLIFGVLLQTSRGVPNFIAFLVTGVFIFTFTSRCVTSGAGSIAGGQGLVRALHFPRACLPFAATGRELYRLGWSIAVLLVIVVITGEPISFSWLLIPVAIALQTVFNAGMALIMARLVARVLDISELLPFIMRTWLYASGVFFSVAVFTKGFPEWVQVLLTINPGNIYIEVMRDLLMEGQPSAPYVWPLAVAWALAVFSFGIVYFWRAEASYGRT